MLPAGLYIFTAKNITDMKDKQEVDPTKIRRYRSE